MNSNRKALTPILVAVVVLAISFLGYKIYKIQTAVTGDANNQDLSSEVKRPPGDSPDFGPLPDEYTIGKSPNGPTAPGAGKGGK